MTTFIFTNITVSISNDTYFNAGKPKDRNRQPGAPRFHLLKIEKYGILAKKGIQIFSKSGNNFEIYFTISYLRNILG